LRIPPQQPISKTAPNRLRFRFSFGRMPHFPCGPLGPGGDSAQDIPPFSQHRNLSPEANRSANQNLIQVLAACADGNGSVAIFSWCSCVFELRPVWGARGDAGLEAAIPEIAQSGQKIQQIIRTIDEIAFHTNLLTLNAAVEAAALLEWSGRTNAERCRRGGFRWKREDSPGFSVDLFACGRPRATFF